tara:strand:+ start:33 stop:245 length:213 start_codon:yes stop_codon:yes gene_type:complete
LTSNTAYEVFLALSNEEREKFLMLITKHQASISNKLSKKRNTIDFNKDDAIKYLIETIFKKSKIKKHHSL